jgi:hypothetical protein
LNTLKIILLLKEDTMKNLSFVSLIVAATMIFMGCSEDNLSAPELSQSNQMVNALVKPSPNLTGKTEAVFTFTPPTFWTGTIDFGVAGKYGLTFISLGQMRQYSQARPFEEEIVIYEMGTDWTDPANVYLRGTHTGVMTLANKVPDPVKFRANGKINEAYGPFEQWQGRNYHISGVVTYTALGQPEGAVGTLRIN